jgi:hypothetical protein
MTRASFRQADLERIMKAAKKTGFMVQIDLKTMLVTASPSSHFAHPNDPIASFAPDGEENWDTEPAAPTRMRDIPSVSERSRQDVALFNTLSPKEYHAHYRVKHEEWVRKLPSMPLDKLEIKVLRQFAEHGVNKRVQWRDIKYLGPSTEERLTLRGFIGTENSQKFPDRIETYWLTDAGLQAWKKFEVRRKVTTVTSPSTRSDSAEADIISERIAMRSFAGKKGLSAEVEAHFDNRLAELRLARGEDS